MAGWKTRVQNYVTFLIKRAVQALSASPDHHCLFSLRFCGPGPSRAVAIPGPRIRANDLSALPANLLLIQAWGVNSGTDLQLCVLVAFGGMVCLSDLSHCAFFAFAHGRAMGLALVVGGWIIAGARKSPITARSTNMTTGSTPRSGPPTVSPPTLSSVRFSVSWRGQISMPPPRCQILAWGMLGCVFAAMFSHGRHLPDARLVLARANRPWAALTGTRRRA